MGLCEMNIAVKRKKEKEVMTLMISVYCRGKHGKNRELCEACEELLAYAVKRVERCPMMASKSFCSACKTPCYAPEKREQIKAVMRYAGPRMLLCHPIIAMKHLYTNLKGKKKAARN